MMSYILVVDDDQMMAKTLSDMVSLLDWETQVVNSPRAAIELIRRKRPSLILLDLNMPGVDGLEVCRYIQREPSSAGTPVVFVTAEDDPGTKQRAKEAGAMDYLIKPVDFDSLEQLLKKIPTTLGGMMAPSKVQSPPLQPSPAVVPSSQNTGSLPVKPLSNVPPAPASVPRKPAAPGGEGASAPPSQAAQPAPQPKPVITQPVKPANQRAASGEKTEAKERQ
jgi:CheY-like chemotaxis protein